MSSSHPSSLQTARRRPAGFESAVRLNPFSLLSDSQRKALLIMAERGEVTGSNRFSAVSIPHMTGRSLEGLGLAEWVFQPYGRDSYRITKAGREVVKLRG